MVNRRISWMSQIAAFVIASLVIAGCATQRPCPAGLAVSYESPRSWGFGWSVVLLQDGLALVQFNAEPAEYIRVPQKEVEHIFFLARQIVARKDVMANVVDAQNGTIAVHSQSGVDEASWDELIMPNYGFTVRSMHMQYVDAGDFISKWVHFKAYLAAAVGAAPRIERPKYISHLSERVLSVKASFWEASLPWWQELMERAYRARQVPIDQDDSGMWPD